MTKELANPCPKATMGRLDMGMDGNYHKDEGAHALYDGEIIIPGTTGWPGDGEFFVLKNANQQGPDYTRAVYYAEGARPIHPHGTKVKAGDKIGYPVRHGGTGAYGNFEIGPANSACNDTLCKQYENHGPLPNAQSRQMVFNWHDWVRAGTGIGPATDTKAAGGP